MFFDSGHRIRILARWIPWRSFFFFFSTPFPRITNERKNGTYKKVDCPEPWTKARIAVATMLQPLLFFFLSRPRASTVNRTELIVWTEDRRIKATEDYRFQRDFSFSPLSLSLSLSLFLFLRPFSFFFQENFSGTGGSQPSGSVILGHSRAGTAWFMA